MAATSSLDWLYHALAYGLVIASVLLIVLLLFRDRSRGRRRCPKCWYDMSATEGLVCPECGRDARIERRLFKSRRRWKLAALCLLLFPASFALHSWPLVRAGGWTAPIPTRVLLEVYPWSGPDSLLGRALLDRYGIGLKPPPRLGSPTDEELNVLISRAASGNLLASPISERWQRTYGDLLNKVKSRINRMNGGDLVVYPGPRSIKSLPAVSDWIALKPTVRVRARPKWPRGLPILLYAEPDTWWPNWCRDGEEIESAASVPGGEPTAPVTSRFGRYTELDVPLTGRVTIQGTIRVFREIDNQQQRPAALSEPFKIEYETVDSIDDIMQAATSPALDAFLASAVTAVFDPQMMFIRFTQTQPVPPGFDDVVFGAKLEILAGERVLMTAHIRSIGIGNALSGLCTYGNVDCADNDPDVKRLREGDIDPSWRVRIRTDPLWALSELEASKYWKGDVTVPLTGGKTLPQVRTMGTPPK